MNAFTPWCLWTTRRSRSSQAKEQLFATRRGEIEARLGLPTASWRTPSRLTPNGTWWNVQVVRWSGLRAISSASRSSMCSRCARSLKPEHRPAYDKALLEALRTDSP
jgi:hypothetical protein